ncbi:MAG: OmpA family protein [Deltaproteobacteria bacterium]|nr:OmpA family protein [Deltaproteobacteria bacterium]
MKTHLTLLFASLAIAVSGCASSPKPKAAQSPAATQPVMTSQLTTQQQEAVNRAAADTDGLRFDSDILRLCPGVEGPRFAYNSHTVREQFQQSLVVLADCMKTGALSGKSLLTVGHADPRGEEDYNLALGGRRADAVRSALQSLGVDASRVEVSSRGEVDASGTDEAGWAQDRRVDVKLVND